MEKFKIIQSKLLLKVQQMCKEASSINEQHERNMNTLKTSERAKGTTSVMSSMLRNERPVFFQQRKPPGISTNL